MNKYLTKIAQISTMTLQKVHGDSSTSDTNTNAVTSAASLGKIVGREALLGVPILGGIVAGGLLANMAYKSLTKKAFQFKNQHTKDLADTAVIGGLGGIATVGSHHLLTSKGISAGLDAMGKGKKALAIGAVGTGLGLAADYAGLKINRAMGSMSNTKESNVPL